MEDDEIEAKPADRIAPKKVLYCGVCGLPPEYCEFGPNFEKCKPWLKANCPDLYPTEKKDEGATEEEGEGKEEGKEAKSSSKRGGKGLVKPEKEGGSSGGKSKKEEKPPVVNVSRISRNKKKFITVVAGMEKFDIKLSEAAKVFAKKFSCGCSVSDTPSGGEEINIQGDVIFDIAEFIEEKWKISEDSIEIDEKTKKPPK